MHSQFPAQTSKQRGILINLDQVSLFTKTLDYEKSIPPNAFDSWPFCLFDLLQRQSSKRNPDHDR